MGVPISSKAGERRKKDPGGAGVFKLQAVFAGDGGKNCLGKHLYRDRNAEFQASREGALVKPFHPALRIAWRGRLTNLLELDV